MRRISKHAYGRHRYAGQREDSRPYSERGMRKVIAREYAKLIVKAERLERQAKLLVFADPVAAGVAAHEAAHVRKVAQGLRW